MSPGSAPEQSDPTPQVTEAALRGVGPGDRVTMPPPIGAKVDETFAEAALPPKRTLAYDEGVLPPLPKDSSSDATSSDRVARGPKSSSDVTMLESRGGAAPSSDPDSPYVDSPSGSDPWPTNGGASPPVVSRPDYLLRERIGKGGQGEVWTALQTSLDREVAVKIVRTGRGGTRLMNFLHEAYTSAELDHPNIAPIHDLSQTEVNGRAHHLLAMKLIRGRQWDEMLHEDRRDPEYAPETFLGRHLGIFLSICNAVAYAHSKKIAHLDIKPSQVVAGRYGEVYLLDWGLAMTMEDDNPRVSSGEVPKFRSRTTTAKPLGTPAYMAPEQAGGRGWDLGYHTDVYLLGATLFEIVAGYPPHNGTTGTRAFEMARDNDVSPLPPGVPEELARVALRALATEPQDRFPDVESLRGAVQDFLMGAGRQRESRIATREAREFVDRMPAEPSYPDFLEAERLLNKAITLWVGNAEAHALRDRVTVRYAQSAIEARDLQLAGTLLPFVGNREARIALETQLQDAWRRRHGTARQNRLLRVATVALVLGLFGIAAIYVVDLRRSRREIEAANANLERANEQLLTSNAAASAAREEAEGLVTFMVEDLQGALEPIGRLDVLEQVSERVHSYYLSRPPRDDDAEGQLRRGISWRQLGVVMVNQGDLKGAREAFSKYADIVRALLARDPDNPIYRSHLAESLSRQGRVQYAERDIAGAHALDVEVLALREALHSEDPDDLTRRDELAHAYNNLGTDQWRLGEMDSAIAMLRKAMAMREELVYADPTSVPFRANLSWTLGTLGVILNTQGQGTEGLALHEESRDLLLELGRDDPGNVEWRRNLAWTYGSIGEALEARRDFDGALEAYRSGCAIREILAHQDPLDARLKGQLAWSYNKIGGVLQSMGLYDDALAQYRAAIAIREDLERNAPPNAGLQEQLGWSQMRIGTLMRLRGNNDEALAAFNEGVSLYAAMRDASPRFNDYKLYHTGALLKRGQVLAATGDQAGADRDWAEALAEIEPLAKSSPLVEYRRMWATALILVGRVDEARPIALEALIGDKGDEEFRALCVEHGIEAP